MSKRIDIRHMADELPKLIKEIGDVCEEKGFPREIGELGALGVIRQLLNTMNINVDEERGVE